jgi:hypothetical protein
MPSFPPLIKSSFILWQLLIRAKFSKERVKIIQRFQYAQDQNLYLQKGHNH